MHRRPDPNPRQGAPGAVLRPIRAALAMLALAAAGWPAAAQEGQIRRLEPRVVAYLQRTGGPEAIVGAVREIEEWTRGRGLVVTGPPTALFYSDPASTPAELMFWEVRLPVGASGREPVEGEIGLLRTEGIATAACREMAGPPGDSTGQVRALLRWIRVQGQRVNGPQIETYLDGLDDAGPARKRVCFPVTPRR